MTKLIIARHGNTFSPEDTPTRVGARTDLALVEKGRVQGTKIGQWLKENNITPDISYSSELKRTIETAELALAELGLSQTVHPLDIFNEIYYGPDENLTEDKVIARIGEQAIKDWDAHAKVPDGWVFNPQDCINNWKGFAAQILEDEHQYVFVTTSNGIARFAPHLAGNFEDFATNHNIKLSTGAIGILEFIDSQWVVTDWNIKPV